MSVRVTRYDTSELLLGASSYSTPGPAPAHVLLWVIALRGERMSNMSLILAKIYTFRIILVNART